MSVIPLVRATAILPIVKFLEQSGAPSERLLHQAKLPLATLDDPLALIPLHRGFTFTELAAQREGIELLGLLAAQQAQLEDLGLLARFARQSLTLHDFLRTVSALLTTTHNSGARVWVTQKDGRVWFNHQYLHSANQEHPQAQYYACGLYLRIIQLVAAAGWYPTDLHFQASRLRGLEAIDLFSRVKVHFNQPNNAIAFDKSLLSLPLKHSMQGNPSHLQRHYEQLTSSAPQTDFVGVLRQLVRSHLEDGGLPITSAAEAVGLSTRSFQRRLADNGLSYSQLVDQVRFDLAMTCLQNPTVNLTDIAFELGYKEPATFTRAFQRWTGVAPSDYRRQHLQN